MDTASLIIRMTGALALILGLMLGIAFFLKRWGGITGKAAGRYIEVLENRLLLPKRHVSLIKVAGTYFLIGSTEQGMSLLGRMGKDEMHAFENMILKSGREDRGMKKEGR